MVTREKALALIGNKELFHRVIAFNLKHSLIDVTPLARLDKESLKRDSNTLALKFLQGKCREESESFKKEQIDKIAHKLDARANSDAQGRTFVDTDNIFLFTKDKVKIKYHFLDNVDRIALINFAEFEKLCLYLGSCLYAKEFSKIVLKTDRQKLFSVITEDMYNFALNTALFFMAPFIVRSFKLDFKTLDRDLKYAGVKVLTHIFDLCKDDKLKTLFDEKMQEFIAYNNRKTQERLEKEAIEKAQEKITERSDKEAQEDTTGLCAKDAQAKVETEKEKTPQSATNAYNQRLQEGKEIQKDKTDISLSEEKTEKESVVNAVSNANENRIKPTTNTLDNNKLDVLSSDEEAVNTKSHTVSHVQDQGLDKGVSKEVREIKALQDSAPQDLDENSLLDGMTKDDREVSTIVVNKMPLLNKGSAEGRDTSSAVIGEPYRDNAFTYENANTVIKVKSIQDSSTEAVAGQISLDEMVYRISKERLFNLCVRILKYEMALVWIKDSF